MKTELLMVYPEIPITYWGMQYALPFINKKSNMPPLGLITIASLLPEDFHVRLIDLNINPLTKEDLNAADIVFISAMIVQKDSFKQVVEMCNECGVPVAAGGPYATSSYHEIKGVDYFILNEGEVTLPQFLHDLKIGSPQHIYFDETKPDLSQTPLPRFELLDIEKYAVMVLQSSRGCPFSCEFCDIIEMFGRVPRYKSPDQFKAELDALYTTGYRGSVFIVDDNFIGNKQKARELLATIGEWQEKKGRPYTFLTEASINLADDEPLMDLMIAAGFNLVFLGIETPDPTTLALAHKKQNVKADIYSSVEKIQKKGMEVMAGFIVGFDSDREDIFDRQIECIDHAGIPLAMIGLLIALPNTQLYRRLESEGRLRNVTSGNNTHNCSLNFEPIMPEEKLIEGYKKILSSIYHPKKYFQRALRLLKRLPKSGTALKPLEKGDVQAFFKSLLWQTFSGYGFRYLAYLVKVLWYNPMNFSMGINLAVKGSHFFRITDEMMVTERFTKMLDQSIEKLSKKLNALLIDPNPQTLLRLEKIAFLLKRKIIRKYCALNNKLQLNVKDALAGFESRCNTIVFNNLQAAQRMMEVSFKNSTFGVTEG